MQLSVVLLCLGLVTDAVPATPDQSCSDAACRAERAATALLLRYQTSTSGQDDEIGLFGNTLPWIEANGIETLCDYALQVGGLAALSPALRTHVEIMLVKGFNTTDGNGEHYGMGNCHTPYCGSFDDQAWWALAWAKAYELTAQKQYLDRSVEIFEYLRENSWDEHACGGGTWWSSAKTYKNSITNTLFFTLASSLASIHSSESGPVALSTAYFTGWAQKCWHWMNTGGGSSLRRGGSGLFLDGLSSAQCNFSNGNDGGANVTWTYNQGVVLSGLGKLYELTRDETLLHSADAIVDATIQHLTVLANSTFVQAEVSSENIPPSLARVLVEPACGDSGCEEGSDHAMFKGALMRHLGYLRRTAALPNEQRVRYQQFAVVNAESCWWHARESTTRYRRVGSPISDELFGNDWRGPWREAVDNDGHPVATSEIAALSLFASLLPLDVAVPSNRATTSGKRTTNSITETIDSMWKVLHSTSITTRALAIAVLLLLLLSVAVKRRRILGQCGGDNTVYMDIAVYTKARQTDRTLSKEAGETQPLLSNAREYV